MQVSLENTANLERRLTVSLPADRLEGAVGNRLREIARTANIKGFRKGKVPTKVIEQRFGPQVRSEAYGELVREAEAVAVEALGRFDIADAHHRVQEFNAHERVSRRVRITCFRFGGVRV